MCCVIFYYVIDNTLSVVLQCIRFVLCFHTSALFLDSVRLTTETSLCSGTLSVKSNWSWLPVCEDDLTRQNAEVFCRELRCGPPLPDQLALQKNPGKEVWPQNIQCQGNESVLLDCQWLTSTRKECSPSQSVTLTCLGMSRAVVFICLGIFFALPKTVKMVPVASLLGTQYSGLDFGVLHHSCPSLPQGLMGQIQRTNWIIVWNVTVVLCGGTLTSYCFPVPDNVRLSGEKSRCAGTLEVAFRGQWRPVEPRSLPGLDRENAAVLCEQLDCGSAVSEIIIFDNPSGPVWHIDSLCVRKKSALPDCVDESIALNSTVSHQVICSGSTKQPVQLLFKSD